MSDRPLVLIVEDNPRNLKLVRDVLNHAGYRHARGRRPPRRGSRSRASDVPDLVLMDIQLPGMDGVEALGRLRADPATAGHPGGRASPRSP